MKYLITSFLLLLLVLVSVKPAEATFTALCHKTGNNYMYLVVANSAVQTHLGHGDFLYKGSANIPIAAKHLWCSDHVPVLTPSPCLDTLGYDRLEGDDCYGKTPKPTKTATPTATASATPTVTPEASVSASPSPTPTNSGIPRTDLTDGRSDNLGCSTHDCSGNKVEAAQTNAALPATGSHMVEIMSVVGLVGYALRRFAGRLE